MLSRVLCISSLLKLNNISFLNEKEPTLMNMFYTFEGNLADQLIQMLNVISLQSECFTCNQRCSIFSVFIDLQTISCKECHFEKDDCLHMQWILKASTNKFFFLVLHVQTLPLQMKGLQLKHLLDLYNIWYGRDFHRISTFVNGKP